MAYANGRACYKRCKTAFFRQGAGKEASRWESPASNFDSAGPTWALDAIRRGLFGAGSPWPQYNRLWRKQLVGNRSPLFDLPPCRLCHCRLA